MRLIKRMRLSREAWARKKGASGYVWVFTNSHEVVYQYSESREADILHKVMREFQGVLVSDFYAAYDSIECQQQKCLIHLLRDLNNEVLEQPYDEELKQLVHTFALVLKPIIETIDHYGLKRRFLNKHVKSVNRFYKDLSLREYRSEAAIRCKRRFETNKERLFTFLKHDDVPWNNNNAEHAIKAYARARELFHSREPRRPRPSPNILFSLVFARHAETNGLIFWISYVRAKKTSKPLLRPTAGSGSANTVPQLHRRRDPLGA